MFRLFQVSMTRAIFGLDRDDLREMIMYFGETILVVGAGGVFGRYVAPELIARSARVRGAGPP